MVVTTFHHFASTLLLSERHHGDCDAIYLVLLQPFQSTVFFKTLALLGSYGHCCNHLLRMHRDTVAVKLELSCLWCFLLGDCRCCCCLCGWLFFKMLRCGYCWHHLPPLHCDFYATILCHYVWMITTWCAVAAAVCCFLNNRRSCRLAVAIVVSTYRHSGARYSPLAIKPASPCIDGCCSFLLSPFP